MAFWRRSLARLLPPSSVAFIILTKLHNRRNFARKPFGTVIHQGIHRLLPVSNSREFRKADREFYRQLLLKSLTLLFSHFRLSPNRTRVHAIIDSRDHRFTSFLPFRFRFAISASSECTRKLYMCVKRSRGHRNGQQDNA